MHWLLLSLRGHVVGALFIWGAGTVCGVIASRLFPRDGDDGGGIGLGLFLNPGLALFILTAELLVVSGVLFVAARLAVRFGPATNASMNAMLGGLIVLVLVSTGLHRGSSGSLAFFFVVSTPIGLLYSIAILVVVRLARSSASPANPE